MMAVTFLRSRLPTNTVPLSPSVSERALAMPAAYTSMLKPGGSLSLAVGNLSGAAAKGGGATGASLAAASLPAGRPINGDPGGSGAAAAGAAPAAGGLAGGGTSGGWLGGGTQRKCTEESTGQQQAAWCARIAHHGVLPWRKPYVLVRARMMPAPGG